MWTRNATRFDALLEPFERSLQEAAALRPGETVLDVGTGSGTTALNAAARVQPGGRVWAIDVADGAIEAARSRVGGDGIEWIVADAQSYAFAAAAFDAVVSRFATMLFADPVAAHRNLARALRPGGRYVAVVWREIERNLWHRIPMQAVHAHLPPQPSDQERNGPDAFADADFVREVLGEAGFHDIHSVPTDADVFVGRDIDDALAFFDEDAGDQLRAAAGDETTAAIFATARDLLGAYVRPGGVYLPASAWLISAVR